MILNELLGCTGNDGGYSHLYFEGGIIIRHRLYLQNQSNALLVEHSHYFRSFFYDVRFFPPLGYWNGKYLVVEIK